MERSHSSETGSNISPRDEKKKGGINIVIPIGGIGSRFKKDGYLMPKPLINIAGRCMLFWLLDNLNVSADDTVYIGIMKNVYETFNFEHRVAKAFPDINFKFVLLNFETRGAAETLFIILQHIEDTTLPLISLDCDTIYFCNILDTFKTSLSEHVEEPDTDHVQKKDEKTVGGFVFYFKDVEKKGVYSYLGLSSSESSSGVSLIKDIKEKVAISEWANTGAYAFSCSKDLKQQCEKFINTPVLEDVGEYYISTLIQYMMTNKTFYGISVDTDKFKCVGTPEQLQLFLKDIDSGKHRPKPMRVCFDLDGTLVTVNRDDRGDYKSIKPVESNIALLKDLKRLGHYIIIYTARRMKTCGGNVGMVMKQVGETTIKTLERLEIPYDEVIFGKPYADYYIDDLALNAMFDVGKKIGWKTSSSYMSSYRSSSNNISDSLPYAIEPRSFNTIEHVGNTVIKSSYEKTILGEMYFYQHIPLSLKHLFPTVSKISKVGGLKTISMDVINGTTFSHLLVDHCLTVERLNIFMLNLSQIHLFTYSNSPLATKKHDDQIPPRIRVTDFEDRFSTITTTQQPTVEYPKDVNIYSNYSEKMRQRFLKHKEIYDKLPDSLNVFQSLMERLKTYEDEKRGYYRVIIHGDPVFTNAFLTKHNRVVFIDMRGTLGDILTLEGDLLYDLAKVYQSLCGYDLILSDDSEDIRPHCLDETNRGENLPLFSDYHEKYLSELKEAFLRWIQTMYADVRVEDLNLLTASLFFSLIPLHEKHQHLFYHICTSILSK